MAQTLASYLTTTRFVLEDATGLIWSNTQLTLCINLARDRVISDTQCARSIQFIPTVPGQEVYSYATILAAMLALPSPPNARQVQTVVNANFQWSPSFQAPLDRISWPEFNARYRTAPLIQSLPSACAVLGQNLYIGPRPASSSLYQLEIDATWLPVAMQFNTDQETAVPDPFGEMCVPLMAARWAHMNRREKMEADEFEAMYLIELNSIASAQPPYAVSNWYA